MSRFCVSELHTDVSGSDRTSSSQLALPGFGIKKCFIRFVQLLFKVEIIVKKIENKSKSSAIKNREEEEKKKEEEEKKQLTCEIL